MGALSSALGSSVGKKFLMGATGLGLFSFVCIHLFENLLLLTGNKALYNQWTHLLESLAPGLYVIELGLVAFFLVHAIWGLLVWLGKRSARPDGYQRSRNAGGASRKTLSSVSMIITGPLLLAFVVMHVWMFKYGPNVAQGYVQQVGDHGIRDLHRLVIETFGQPVWVSLYVVVMVLLFFHLRHGFWSAFQSLGVMSPRLTPLVYAIGVILALLLAAGFILLPVWIFLTGGGV